MGMAPRSERVQAAVAYVQASFLTA